MTITSIKREFNLFPNIVGIVTTDSITEISTAGYFSSESANVTLLNNGVWEWEPEDIVLIYYSNNQIGWFTYDSVSDSFIPQSSIKLTGSLTSTQINNMYTTPVQILPSPGVGKYIYVNKFIMNLIYNTTQYTGGGSIGLEYGNASHLSGTPATDIADPTTFTGPTSNSISFLQGALVDLSVTSSSILNQAIFISNQTAVFATGNSKVNFTIDFGIFSGA